MSEQQSQKPPRLSIIIPAYNVGLFIDRCLASVHEQTYKDFEVILIDDGSTDQTLMIGREWCTRDQRFRLIAQKNQGVAIARNVGLEAVRGELLTFVDSDDYLEATALEKLVERLDSTGADIAMCRFVQESVGGDALKQPSQPGEEILTREEAYVQVLFDRRIRSYPWGKLYRRELFDGVRYPEGKILEDYSICNHLFYRAIHGVATIREVLYHYVQHDQSIMNAQHYAFAREEGFFEAVYARYLHARESNLLTPRQLAFFQIKTCRRLLRTFFKMRRSVHNAAVVEEITTRACVYLSDVRERVIPRSKLKYEWRMTRIRRLGIALFYWKRK